MKKVTTSIQYLPRSATAIQPTLKAVLIDKEKFVLNEYKAYTYAPADFVDDNTPIVIYENAKADLSNIKSVLGVKAKIKANDASLDIMTQSGSDYNIGIAANGQNIVLYEWGLGQPISTGYVTVADDGMVSATGYPPAGGNCYMAAKVSDIWKVSQITAGKVDTDKIPATQWADFMVAYTADSGSYKLNFGTGKVTEALAYNANAAVVQTAIRQISGYSSTTVTGNAGNYTVTLVNVNEGNAPTITENTLKQGGENASVTITLNQGYVGYSGSNGKIYVDYFGIYDASRVPVSVYLTIEEESNDDTYRCKLTEITNYNQIAEMYGIAALATRGNIAYSAGNFLLKSGGNKSFYIAPMTSQDDIADLIEELKNYDDAYYLIYNKDYYTNAITDIGALKSHVLVMSGPLYKRERRLYVKELMEGESQGEVQGEKDDIINSALALDHERVSLVTEYAETDALIEYCARRYNVNRDYSMTWEPIAIGNIWNYVSLLSDSEKEELKDNGVIFFDQETPTSIPIVMYQTTTYIENDILAKKEENIQIAIDELCRTIRQICAPRIAKGLDNKVTADPNSKESLAYIKNLNADIAVVRRVFINTFASIEIQGIEIDQNDPRQVRMHITAVPYYNVNRIDVYIYVL